MFKKGSGYVFHFGFSFRIGLPTHSQIREMWGGEEYFYPEDYVLFHVPVISMEKMLWERTIVIYKEGFL